MRRKAFCGLARNLGNQAQATMIFFVKRCVCGHVHGKCHESCGVVLYIRSNRFFPLRDDLSPYLLCFIDHPTAPHGGTRPTFDPVFSPHVGLVPNPTNDIQTTVDQASLDSQALPR